MGTACNCMNPTGGGTKCPNQHVAICIRERDGECYGECIPIPGKYYSTGEMFRSWLQFEITSALKDFIEQKTSLKSWKMPDVIVSPETLNSTKGSFQFQLGSDRIYLMFRFEFRSDSPGVNY